MKTLMYWLDRINQNTEVLGKTIQAIIDDARAGMVPEGELAKAWEAGRDAAALTVLDSGTGLLPGVALERIASAVRKLQPPGGKAKHRG